MKRILTNMSHHYGEYWTEWSDLKRNPDADKNEDNLLMEVKSFLLTLEQHVRPCVELLFLLLIMVMRLC